ncbi:MAG: leucyl aminopeptidase, partial [Novosphingobium sp.]|nr:leucyl aminopeptidase [Novosphingobium sp.]
MEVQFLDTQAASGSRLVAYVVNQDAIPADLEPVLSEAARASRFSGKAGQLFEGFVDRGGQVVRVALAGIGSPSDKDRRSAIERAGAGLAAKYLTSGETGLTFDLTGSGLTAEETAALLLGARLRAWRHDTYRTTLKDDQKKSLEKLSAIGADSSAQAEWEREAALADGVEFTRELVAEPANVIYPEAFVERCKARMEGTGIVIRVLDEGEMRKLGMGALLGV